MTVDDDQLREMYRRMTRIRQFENTTKELLLRGELYGAFHTSTGQEASIVGSCMALRSDDYMVGTHRSHGHPIGKGAKVDRLLAELMGKETGINHGKGGSMHLSDFGVGSLGETSIVGSGLPVATGAALGSKMQGSDRVTLCFFGDGASSEGTFHESLNLAALWTLPVVYVCENNGYGEMTATRDAVAIEHIADRAAGYNMPGVTVDGQDVLAVYEAVDAAVRRARVGQGPSLVETKTYRFENHAIGLPIENYRPAEEVEDWKVNRDPLELYRAALTERGWDPIDLKEIDEEVAGEIAAAVEFGRSSATPPVDAAYTNVFTNPVPIAR
ncbi:thiamine pyrophosphate-dependent dehydrogenase E1 component subunit alpha [Georgenia thermotolerans]|uniref:Pyruvate dehydrogenase (Acetyl-transferring) E1 component subunit alpha n=1 Tax=Georgenia thermotolerans TaxID=527326 RepID=A0A7J5UV18_9MICO|nr:thiamine pyrophosphate-dependent dehydrogenase E1 component subunit alpha [Georgenia thermotolerans]KAE8766116.1 pyruvate dehydrogenase (acetyl-transferring) E1 component subunit alpha [Georgenia thermotolerans]